MEFKDLQTGSWFYCDRKEIPLMKSPFPDGAVQAIDEYGNLYIVDPSTEVRVISFFTAKDLEERDRFILWPMAVPGHLIIGKDPFAIFTLVNGFAFCPDEDGFSSIKFKPDPDQRVLRVG